MWEVMNCEQETLTKHKLVHLQADQFFSLSLLQPVQHSSAITEDPEVQQCVSWAGF